MSKITNVCIYGLNESMVAAGYPMRTEVGDINEDITSKKYPKSIDKLAMCKAGSGNDNFLKGVIVQFDLTEGKYSAQKASLYAKPNDSKDLAEKIIFLLDNEEKRVEMGQYGMKRIKNELSWEHTSKELLRGYDTLFASIKSV